MVHNGFLVRNHFDSSSHHHPGPSHGTSDHRKSFTAVIGEVLLDPTQTTRLMGKPSDSDKTKSAREWAGLQVNTTCDECTQNTSVIPDQDTRYLCLPNSSPLSGTQQQDGNIIRLCLVMMSAQVLFTRRVSGCVSECDPSQH